MSWRGPAALFLAWAIHDAEEALTFPATCARLAERTGIKDLKITSRQSWGAVGLMGAVVATACLRGAKTNGESKMYRSVVAGLEAHVVTHIAASIVMRGYTAGVATAIPIMLPGALMARRELKSHGNRLGIRDTLNGLALLLPAAGLCQVAARRMFR